MSKIELDPTARGADFPPLDINKLNKMKEVTTMGQIDAKETTELLVALAKVAVATKESMDDDGRITGGDVTHFVPVFIPLVNGVLGIDKIPAEFADGYDDIEKADMKTKVHTALKGIAENDDKAVDAGLDVIYALQHFFITTGVIKPTLDKPSV